MELTIFLIFLMILSGFIKGFVGFGLSLLLITVLLQAGIEPVQLLPILVPLFVILDIILYFENQKFVTLDFKENFTIHSTTLMTLFIGTMFGAYLLQIIDPSFMKLLFSITVLFVLLVLIGKVNLHQMKLPNEKSNAGFGLVSGLMTGLFTINAVPVSMYLLYHQYPKDKYMGSLVTFLMFSNVILIAVYLFGGLFTYEGFKTSIQLIGIVLVGFFMGIFLRRKISSKYFKSIVILILALSAVKGIFDYFNF